MLKKISEACGLSSVPLTKGDIKKYENIPRFTYRCNFQAIQPGNITSDSGWGCCYRSAQGLIASYFLNYAPVDAEYFFTVFNEIPMFSLFEDRVEMPFSIQNLVYRSELFGVKPGTWAKPSQLAATIESIFKDLKLSVLISKDSNIIPEDVKTMRAPFLLLIPILLGMKDVEQKFIPFIKYTFQRPEFLGAVSGSSDFSYFLVGLSEDQNVVYFDPHVTKQAVASSFDHSEFFEVPPRGIKMKSLNPSFLLGFFCSSTENAISLIEDITKLKDSPITFSEIRKDLVDQVLDIDDIDL
ncbi:Clan CA, family C54, ATG4-like cysteine peptidase [Trichomonas vaginalis G3]|uniref:Cysteine protease n=1 Tax=Trichomonas vaginalis (strain ATCC PRA-98 / G3) TaxID=412133 RepID=A2DXA2_TRIV3|nr:protein delipidation [Trichomonas vaginalis G3]EAY14984.1 Clan CA, family C54, ATG4-like cysteine peptidase [Trichomonas vaginalis G3]KAI5507339.1 protein delipidation [Trichomonas vaginalis G3]|eukprot:XP_001327207.1 Clan CA, family C54, ATG4-like cysteine peptidase [Trichomonas vaginalis G3]